MKNKYDILVTDSRFKHSLSIVRNLGKHGLNIATCSNGLSPTKYSKYSKDSFNYNDDNFEKEILNFLKNNDVDLVIPVGYSSNQKCSKIKDDIMKYSNIVIDDYEKVSSVSDKQKILPILNKSKLLYPRTIPVNKIADIEKIKGSSFVVKSAEEGVGEKVRYANSKKELLSIVKERLDLGPQIIQDYINGKARGFFAFCKDGKVLQSFQHERIRQYPESGGVSSCSRSINDEKLNVISIDFLKKLKWTGPVMLEFIYSEKDKKYYFIEMNAKFWGSYDLSVFCGINFAKIPYDIIKENKITKKKYKVNRKFQWVLPEDTLRIKTSKNKRVAFQNWTKDLFDKRVGKDIQYIFNDPIPTFIRIISTTWSYLFRK